MPRDPQGPLEPMGELEAARAMLVLVRLLWRARLDRAISGTLDGGLLARRTAAAGLRIRDGVAVLEAAATDTERASAVHALRKEASLLWSNAAENAQGEGIVGLVAQTLHGLDGNALVKIVGGHARHERRPRPYHAILDELIAAEKAARFALKG